MYFASVYYVYIGGSNPIFAHGKMGLDPPPPPYIVYCKQKAGKKPCKDIQVIHCC